MIGYERRATINMLHAYTFYKVRMSGTPCAEPTPQPKPLCLSN